MGIVTTLWSILTDQRGQWDFGGMADSIAGLGQDISSYLPTDTGGGFSGLNLSPGQALSVGPVGDIGGSGGFGGFGGLMSSFGDIAKGIVPFAQLGTGLMGLTSGIRGGMQLGQQTKLAEQAAKKSAGVADPLAAFSQSQIGAAEAGKIPPAVQAQIDQWTQGAKQRVMDLAARTGQGQSSQLQSWLSWIDQQAQAMAAQALQDEISQGIGAGGVAGQLYGQSGQIAAQQQGGMQQLIEAANQALARLG